MLLLISIGASAAAAEPAAPPEAAAGVAPFIDGQTIFVARLDASAVDVGAVETWMKQAAQPPGPGAARFLEGLHEGIGRITAAQADFKQAGGRLLYVVVSFGDTPGGLAFVVAPIENGADAKAMEKVLSAWSPDPATRAATIGKAVVLPFGDALAHLEHFTPAPRPELAKMFAEAGDAPLSAAVIPSEQVRRVVEAMAPRLPAVVGGGPIAVLTRGLMSGSIAVRLPPGPSVRVVIHSQDADAANAFTGLVRLALLTGRDQIPPEMAGLLAALVRPPSPKVEGDSVTFSLDEKPLMSLVRQVPGGPRHGALAAYRVKSASNIRQLVLACIVYANDHKNEFPDSLEEAFKGTDVPREVMTNPADPSRKPGYVYVKPPALKELTNAPGRVIVYEAFDKWDAGINVGFADGHVEFIADQAVFVKYLNGSGVKVDRK